MRNRAELKKLDRLRIDYLKAWKPSNSVNGEVSGECIKAPRMTLGFKDFALNLTQIYGAIAREKY